MKKINISSKFSKFVKKYNEESKFRGFISTLILVPSWLCSYIVSNYLILLGGFLSLVIFTFIIKKCYFKMIDKSFKEYSKHIDLTAFNVKSDNKIINEEVVDSD